MTEDGKERIIRIEGKIESMEEKLTRIDNEAEQISDIKSTVENISTKLDERTENTNDKFKGHSSRLSRLGLKFWILVLAVLGGKILF